MAAAHGLDHPLDQHGMGDPEGAKGEHGDDGDKPLTSKYRGVCWNKKNRRWQAAINSSGKYIYLGSFLEEEEAARMFDRAAVRLRGNRAKLNFSVSDYSDANGELLIDEKVAAIIVKAETAAAVPSGKAGRPGGDHQGQLPSSSAHHPGASGAGGAGRKLSPLLQRPGSGSGDGGRDGAPMATLGLGRSPPAPPGGYTVSASFFKGRSINALDVPLPTGCTLECTIPGEDDAFGILYLDPGPQRHLGAVIWDGFASQDLGVYDTDRDARTACNSALRIVLQYKNQNALLLQSVAETLLPNAAATNGGTGGVTVTSQQPHSQPAHRRPSSPSGFNVYQETLGLDALQGQLVHPASLDAATLGPVAVLSTGGATLAQGFGGGPGLTTAATTATLHPSGNSGGQRAYADLFSFISHQYKGAGGGSRSGGMQGTTLSVGPGGLTMGGDEESGVGTDLAGLIAQMNGGGAGGGGEGLASLPSLSTLPSLPLMLGRVPNNGAMAAGHIVAAALPAGITAYPKREREMERESDDGGSSGATGSERDLVMKRPKFIGGGGAVALPLAMAGAATLGLGGSGVPAEFSQMKTLSNLSVQDVMKHLNASSGG